MLPRIGLRLIQSRLLCLDAILLGPHAILLRLIAILLGPNAVLLRLYPRLLGLFARLSLLLRFHSRLRLILLCSCLIALRLCLRLPRLLLRGLISGHPDPRRLRRPHPKCGGTCGTCQQHHPGHAFPQYGALMIQQHDPLLQWVGLAPVAGHWCGLHRKGGIEYRVGIAPS